MNNITAIDVFQLIDRIRHERGLSINALCENIMDVKTYWRYFQELRIPNTDVTIKLICKLGLLCSEFFYILEQQ